MSETVRKILQWIRGDGDPLYPYEVSMFKEIASSLSHDEQVILMAQVERVNKVQRHAHGKEVNLYQVKHGKPHYDEMFKFSGAEGERKLATVQLGAAGIPSLLKADIWVVSGHVFSIIYSKSPEEFFSLNSLVDADLRVVNKEVYDVKSKRRAVQLTFEHTPEPLKNWERLGAPCQFYVPLEQKEVVTELAAFSCWFPGDYIELLKYSNGLSFSGGRIHGADRLRIVLGDNKNLCVLAELDNARTVYVATDQNSEDIYISDHSGEEEKKSESNSLLQTVLTNMN